MMAEQPAAAQCRVSPEPGSRLEQLLTRREALIAAAAEAAARKDAVNDAIKAELSALAPAGTHVIDLPASPHWPALRLAWRTPWIFDSKKLKAEDPQTYVRYARQSGRWELRALDGGSS